MNSILATPAYGRRYTSIEDLCADWLNGLDFKLVGGPYFSIRDAPALVQMGHKWLFITTCPVRQCVYKLIRLDDYENTFD